MELSDGKAIKTGQWLVNEILHVLDINYIGESTYQNFTDQLALLVQHDLIDFEGIRDFVFGEGLELQWTSVLSATLTPGAALSTQGAYLNSDVWGFIASAGKLFSVVIPDDGTVTFAAGGTNARIDTLEIQPAKTTFNTVNRQFKDPITGLVGSSNVATRKEYGYTFAIRKGDDTTALTKEITTFTVNTATVGSNIAGKYILFSTIYDDYYVWYDTGASSDPAVSGRTGIRVSVAAGADDDAIALATRVAITVSGVVVTGATNQVILTGTTYANLTNSTNGDMTTYFDTIAITQGNGATIRTAGWIKIAEISVGASAAAITQGDILGVRDSHRWQNNPSGTQFVSRGPASIKSFPVELGVLTETRFQERDLQAKLSVSMGGNLTNMCFDGQFLWVGNDEGNCKLNGIDIDDYEFNKYIASGCTGGNYNYKMVSSGRYLWVSALNSAPDMGKVDTYSGTSSGVAKTLAAMTVGNCRELTASDDYIWAANSDGTTPQLIRFKILDDSELAIDVSAWNGIGMISALCFDGTYVWATNDGYDGLFRISMDGTVVAKPIVSINNYFDIEDICFDPKTNKLWIANSSDELIEYNIATGGHVSHTITFGSGWAEHMAFDGRSIWITNQDTNTQQILVHDTVTNDQILITPTLLGAVSGKITDICWDGRHMWCSNDNSTHELIRFTAISSKLYNKRDSG